MKNNLAKLIEYIFYLFIFFLPWQTRWIFHQGKLNGGDWEYGTMSLYGVDLLLVLMVVFGAIYLFKNKAEIKLNKSFIILIIFLFWAGLSIFWSLNPILSAYYFLRLFFLFFLIFIISIIKIDFKKLALVFFSAGIIQSFLAIWQFLSQSFFVSKWLGIAEQTASRLGASVIEINGARFLRAYGSFPHPNILGGFLGICLLFTLWLIFEDEKKRKILIYPVKFASQLFNRVYFLPILILGLLVSFSKSAILGFLICFCLFYFVKIFTSRHPHSIVDGESITPVIPAKAGIQKIFSTHFLSIMDSRLRGNDVRENGNDAGERESHKNYKSFFIILISLVIFTILLWPFISARVSSTQRLEVLSQNERLLQLNDAKQLIKNHWFIGSGINTYTAALYEKHPQNEGYFYQPVHNIFLIIWGELGIIGLILFLFFLFYIFHLLFSKKIFQERRIIFLPLLLFLIIIGLFDHYLWTLNCGIVLWWLILGLNLNKDDILENLNKKMRRSLFL